MTQNNKRSSEDNGSATNKRQASSNDRLLKLNDDGLLKDFSVNPGLKEHLHQRGVERVRKSSLSDVVNSRLLEPVSGSITTAKLGGKVYRGDDLGEDTPMTHDQVMVVQKRIPTNTHFPKQVIKENHDSRADDLIRKIKADYRENNNGNEISDLDLLDYAVGLVSRRVQHIESEPTKYHYSYNTSRRAANGLPTMNPPHHHASVATDGTSGAAAVVLGTSINPSTAPTPIPVAAAAAAALGPVGFITPPPTTMTTTTTTTTTTTANAAPYQAYDFNPRPGETENQRKEREAFLREN